MHVEIETLTSKVSVGEGAAPNLELIEKIVAIVLSRIKDEHAAQASAHREQEIHPHMSKPDRY
jgi:hypothetical protein